MLLLCLYTYNKVLLLQHESYIFRSAKFDVKLFNFFARLFILFYFRSEMFPTSMNGKIK